jgi:hypothetical protein
MAIQISIIGGYTGTSAGSVPVDIGFDSAVGALLQRYFNAISTAITASPAQFNLDDFDIATGHDYHLETIAAAGLAEFTNIDTAGSPSSGMVTTGLYSIAASSVAMVAQAPASYSLTGSPATNLALLGSTANIDYNVTSPTLHGASIFGGGGSNSININGTASVNIFSAGADSLYLNGLGDDHVTAYSGADDLVTILEGSATVTALGNATVGVTFDEHAGANLDFINNATTPQTVFSGAYTAPGGGSVFAPNSVTAFGGAGGGYFVGGLAGQNSLVGGAGAVTLQAGGPQDFLEATGASNVFFSGNGTETLDATSTTGANLFQLGGPYTGKGTVTTSGSTFTSGAGNQVFFIANVQSETITGSQSLSNGAQNVYDVIGDSTAGGGSFTITDFTAFPSSVLYLTGFDGAEASDASISVIGAEIGNPGTTQILLSDGTVMTLRGVAPAAVQTINASAGIVAIYHA